MSDGVSEAANRRFLSNLETRQRVVEAARRATAEAYRRRRRERAASDTGEYPTGPESRRGAMTEIATLIRALHCLAEIGQGRWLSDAVVTSNDWYP